MAEMTAQGTLPVAAADMTAAPVTNTLNHIMSTFNGNNIDENNVDFTNPDGIMALSKAQTVAGIKTHSSEIIMQDNVNLTFGTGSDATIDYDATNLVVNPKVVGSGYVDVQGDLHVANGQGVVIGHTAQVATNTTNEFQVLGSGQPDSGALLARFSADATAPQFQFLKSRNATIGSNTILNDNDAVGTLTWRVADNNDFSTQVASFSVEVDDASPAQDQIGGAMVFGTTATTSNAPTEAFRVASDQNIYVADGNGVVIGHTAQLTTGALNEFQVLGTAAADSRMTLGVWSTTDSTESIFEFVKSGNAAIGSSTIVADNESIGAFIWRVDDGTDFATAAARISAEVDDGTPAENAVGGALTFDTATTAGTLTEAFRVASDQNIYVADGNGIVIGHSAQIYSGQLEVTESSANNTVAFSTWSTTDGHNNSLSFYKSGSATVGTYAETADGETIAAFDFYGSDSSSTVSERAATIKVVQDGAAGATRIPTRIVFETGTNAATATEAMRINSARELMIGHTTSSEARLLSLTQTAAGTTNWMTLNNDVTSGTDSGKMLRIDQNYASATGQPLYVEDAATGNQATFELQVQGAKADGSWGQYVYTNANQQESALVFLESDNASSDHGTLGTAGEGGVLAIQSDGSGSGITINGNTGNALFATMTNTGTLLQLRNDGTNSGFITIKNAPMGGTGTAASLNERRSAATDLTDDSALTLFDVGVGAEFVRTEIAYSQGGTGRGMAIIHGRPGAGNSVAILVQGGGATFGVVTSEVTGTTGTDGFINVGYATDGQITVENRLGSTIKVWAICTYAF